MKLCAIWVALIVTVFSSEAAPQETIPAPIAAPIPPSSSDNYQNTYQAAYYGSYKGAYYGTYEALKAFKQSWYPGRG